MQKGEKKKCVVDLSLGEDDLVRGSLLSGLAKDIHVPALAVRDGDVEPEVSDLLEEARDGLVVVVRKLDLLKVGLDARLCDRLGDDRVAALDAPGDEDLCGVGVELVGDGLDLRVVYDLGLAGEVVAEGRVGGDVDVVLCAVGDEVVLGEEGVCLDLVDGGGDAGGLDDGVEVLDGKVGDTDRLDLALFLEGEEGLVRVDDRDAAVEGGVLAAVGGGGEVGEVGALECDGPVDEVEVEVVEAELGERVVEGSLDEGGLVGIVPELGCDEELVALDDGGDDLLERGADLVLVLVDLGQVQVTVASLDGNLDGVLDLSGLGEPRAETDLGDLVAVVEGDGLPEMGDWVRLV